MITNPSLEDNIVIAQSEFCISVSFVHLCICFDTAISCGLIRNLEVSRFLANQMICGPSGGWEGLRHKAEGLLCQPYRARSLRSYNAMTAVSELLLSSIYSRDLIAEKISLLANVVAPVLGELIVLSLPVVRTRMQVHVCFVCAGSNQHEALSFER